MMITTTVMIMIMVTIITIIIKTGRGEVSSPSKSPVKIVVTSQITTFQPQLLFG